MEGATPNIPEDAGFETFWSVFPRKHAKVAARKAWVKLSRTKKLPPLEYLISRVRANIGGPWSKNISAGEIHFIPLPATWLNGERWCDQLRGESSPSVAPTTSNASGARKTEQEAMGHRACRRLLAGYHWFISTQSPNRLRVEHAEQSQMDNDQLVEQEAPAIFAKYGRAQMDAFFFWVGAHYHRTNLAPGAFLPGGPAWKMWQQEGAPQPPTSDERTVTP